MARISQLALSMLAAAPLCHAFSPSAYNVNHQTVMRASSNANEDIKSRHIEQAVKVAGSSLLALTLAFAPQVNAVVDTTLPSTPLSSSILTSSTTDDADKAALEALEKETKALEKETAALKKKARVERGREAFYDYEAKMAAETEARIEAAERKAELEYENDKAELEDLALLELKKERAAKLASSDAEKRQLEKEAKVLLKKEKELERKERQAARAEKIYLAEETREKEILKLKTEAAKKEDAKFEQVEKQYEEDMELVKEEEAELSLVKDLMRKKK
jgi:phage-related minor tail protein